MGYLVALCMPLKGVLVGAFFDIFGARLAWIRRIPLWGIVTTGKVGAPYFGRLPRSSFGELWAAIGFDSLPSYPCPSILSIGEIMLDTLLLVASLSHPPIGHQIRVPAPPAPVQIPARPLVRPESLTTCHESAAGSCWSE